MLEDSEQTLGRDDTQSLQISRLVNGLSLIAVDHKNLRGLILKGRPSPIRRKVFDSIETLFENYKLQKIHPQVLDSELFGGLDFARTFETGRPAYTHGYLKQNKFIILLSMAERLEASLICKYSTAIDLNNDLNFIVSDESAEDETINDALTDRLAFSVSVDNLHYTQIKNISFNLAKIKSAKQILESIPIDPNVIQTLTEVSLKLGIDSLRAPILASYAARASAAFSKNSKIMEEDIFTSIKLVLSHRAKVLPEIEDTNETDGQNEPSPKEDNDEEATEANQESTIPAEMLLDAIKSSLSPEVLKNLIDKSKNLKASKANSGSGKRKLSNRRGRPLPSRAGKLDNTKRLDVVETLKSAAPWQTIRKKRSTRSCSNIIIRSSDIKIKRHEEQSDRLIIFSVDASGTSAMGRLGETKGAIEILLSEAYARRDQVALISFRGQVAKIELPPTRSLVQTKKRLAGLPAGGGTPLASGLSVSYDLALQAKTRGMTPSLAFLTDGKGNICLDGTPSRKKSETETEDLARKISFSTIPAIVIDTSNRPQNEAKILAKNLNAMYLALPRADSKRLSAAVATVMD